MQRPKHKQNKQKHSGAYCLCAALSSRSDPARHNRAFLEGKQARTIRALPDWEQPAWGVGGVQARFPPLSFHWRYFGFGPLRSGMLQGAGSGVRYWRAWAVVEALTSDPCGRHSVYDGAGELGRRKLLSNIFPAVHCLMYKINMYIYIYIYC